MTAGIDFEKRRIRAEVRAGRATMDPDRRDAVGRALTERLVALVRERGARSICCYLPVGGEPDTEPFLEWATGHGVEVLLPATRGDGVIEWVRLAGGGVEPGGHGIPEPAGPRLPTRAAERVDLMLVPACAVDERGIRLGWGLGYYDRCLAALEPRPPVFAVVHDAEIVPLIPAEPHDVPVDGAVTPGGVRRFGGAVPVPQAG